MKRPITVIATLGVLGMAGASLAAFIDLDANGDGALTSEEFSTGYPEAPPETFIAVDTNGDGMVTEEEMTAAVDAGILPAE